MTTVTITEAPLAIEDLLAAASGAGGGGWLSPAWIHGGTVYYLLLYDVVDQFIERRAPYRDAHLKSARLKGMA
jgi:hypothetical protein